MSPTNEQILADGLGLAQPALGPMAGFNGWNGDPRSLQAGAIAISGTMYVFPVWYARPTVVENLWCACSTAGSTLTAAQNLISIYNANGQKLADSADQSGVWTSTGTRAAPITPQSIPALTMVYVTLLSVGTTPPNFARLSNSATLSNAGQTGSNMTYAVNGTGLSATPASFSPASNNPSNVQAYWVATS